MLAFWHRKKYVYLNGITSSLRDITCGVPQSSVLASLLFLLYKNDLPNITKILNFYLFADDTNIYYENDSLEEMEKIINIELKKLSFWLRSKTNFVIFRHYNKKLKYITTLKIDKKAIDEKNWNYY